MLKLFNGMLTVFKHLFKRPVTLEYPEKKLVPPENFRGKPVVKDCAGCHICEKVCPSGAIKVSKESITIDMKKCIFCGNCAFYCAKGAIKMSGEYELASQDKKDLELVYEIKREGENNERNQ